MKKKITVFLLILSVIFSQFIINAGTIARADSFMATVVVEGNNGVIVSDSASKTNAFEALQEVLDKHDIKMNVTDYSWGKYITSIDGIQAGQFGGYDGWNYAVNRGGKYVDITTGISDFTLQNGDKLIMYYGDENTLAANDINFSTTLPDTDLTITLNNIDSYTKTNTPINNVKVEIDQKDEIMQGNKIILSGGLAEGVHTLQISDFKTNSSPGVVADTFTFNMEYPTVSVRVEGLNGTIVEDTQSGKNALDILEKVLDKHNVKYSVSQYSSGNSYISSIDGLTAGKFGGWDGWLYYIKSNNAITTPDVGMDSFVPEDGQSLVVYYGDYTTPYANKITFTPEIPKSNQGFEMRFGYEYNDYTQNKEVDMPIQNAIVKIDNNNYITDKDGQVSVEGLSEGQHTYEISGYNINKLPTVVMDKGVFTIDNQNPPILNYGDSTFDELQNQNNTGSIEDIPGTEANALNYIENSTQDPWAAVSLKKFNLGIKNDYLVQNADYIEKYGSSDYSSTELEKLIIYLTADGYSPYKFAGSNLVSELFNRDIKNFLINDAAFGLITYKYSNISGNYKITQSDLVDYLLNSEIKYTVDNKQITGWSLYGAVINPDLTGIVINALSQFYNTNEKVKEAVDSAVNSLSVLQNQSGYLADEYGYFSESLSFTILGLTSVGVNPQGVLFTKEKGDLVSALLSYRGTQGQFKHSLDGENNYIATEEALRALIALQEYKQFGIYDFYKSDINAQTLPEYIVNKPAQSTTNSKGKPQTYTGSSTGKTVALPVNTSTQSTYGNGLIDNNSETILNLINSQQDNNLIRVNASKNDIISKSIFDAIKGKNQSVEFIDGNLTWIFNGRDINSQTKDVNISLNASSEYKNKILKMINNKDIYILSFKNNGILPGKAQIKVKLDSKWLQGKNENSMYLYYYNPQSNQIEEINGPLSVDKNGYITIEIAHCSEYFITDTDLSSMPKIQNNKLTFSTMGIIGLLIACISIFLIVFNKKLFGEGNKI